MAVSGIDWTEVEEIAADSLSIEHLDWDAPIRCAFKGEMAGGALSPEPPCTADADVVVRWTCGGRSLFCAHHFGRQAARAAAGQVWCPDIRALNYITHWEPVP